MYTEQEIYNALGGASGKWVSHRRAWLKSGEGGDYDLEDDSTTLSIDCSNASTVILACNNLSTFKWSKAAENVDHNDHANIHINSGILQFVVPEEYKFFNCIPVVPSDKSGDGDYNDFGDYEGGGGTPAEGKGYSYMSIVLI